LMFLSSAPASYQFVVLIAVAAPTISVLVSQRQWKCSLVYLSLYFLACNIRAIHLDRLDVSVLTPLFYLTLWSGVALLIFYSVLLKNPIGDRVQSERFWRRPALTAGVLVLALWILGAQRAWSHLKNMREAAETIIPRDGAYLRVVPVSTDHGVRYVAMLRDGYRVLREGGAGSDVMSHLEREGDELSFATSASGQTIWIEVASVSGSHLIHVGPDGRTLPTREIDNSESPVLSGDESVLAFLREVRGQGSLWSIDLHDRAAAVRMTLPAYDVRSATAGPGDTFIVSAIYHGKERIFTVSGGSTLQLIAEDAGGLNFPALSPDGSMLVVRKLISQRWQLALLDLSSHAWRQLTYRDCNAYTPSWKDNQTLLYATDCMRGLGLTALASLKIDR